jgi:hypothetical protein
MQKSEYQIQLAKDSLSVLFMRVICSRSFNKKILCKIMGVEYRESSARVVAWDDTRGGGGGGVGSRKRGSRVCRNT